MSDSSERTVLTFDFAVSPLSSIEETLFLWCHLLMSLPHTCTEENSRKNCDWTIRIWRSSAQDIGASRGKKYSASIWSIRVFIVHGAVLMASSQGEMIDVPGSCRYVVAQYGQYKRLFFKKWLKKSYLFLVTKLKTYMHFLFHFMKNKNKPSFGFCIHVFGLMSNHGWKTLNLRHFRLAM